MIQFVCFCPGSFAIGLFQCQGSATCHSNSFHSKRNTVAGTLKFEMPSGGFWIRDTWGSLFVCPNEPVNIQLTRTAGLNESIFDDRTAPFSWLSQEEGIGCRM